MGSTVQNALLKMIFFIKYAENCSMSKYFYSIIVIFLIVFSSCAGIAKTKTKPQTLEPPKYIMGKGNVTGESLSLFLIKHNPQVNPAYIRTLSKAYIEEAGYEGVNHDVAFAQMCLETGYLKFGGLVKPEWNNFCGLGAIGPEQPGLIFPDSRTGVRAHVQHLKAYAATEPLKGDLVDPRYKYVRKGSSPVIDGLAGTWAADKMYAVKINDILQRLYVFAF
jgi:hypothetical protein